jgi:hypothetical protein
MNADDPIELRAAQLARSIVVNYLDLRDPVTHLTSKPFPIRPTASDFLNPLRVLLRVHELETRIDEAKRKPENEARTKELQDELVGAEREFVRLVL